MRTRALCLAAVLLGMTAPVIMATPALACDGVTVQTQAPKNMVLFYTAEHPSLRCAWQWGDDMTQIKTQTLPLEEAKALFNRKKEAARSNKYFQDYGTWFIYYYDASNDPNLLSHWRAVGYYGVGQKPFSKP